MNKSETRQIIRCLGGPNVVAEWCGVTASAVSQWPRVPVRHVLTIEAKSAGKTTRHELRPDVYPQDEAAA